MPLMLTRQPADAAGPAGHRCHLGGRDRRRAARAPGDACSWSSTPRWSARSPAWRRPLDHGRPRRPRRTAVHRRACARGTRGVALSLSAELADVRRGRPVRARTLTPELGSAAFTWAITGLGLGLIASFVRTQLPRRHRPAACLPRRAGPDPRADRPVRTAELGPRPGGPGRPDRERGARRAAGGRPDRPHPARRGAHSPRRRHRASATPTSRSARSWRSTAWSPATCAWSGTASPSRSTAAAAWRPSSPASWRPGLDPQAMDLPRRLSALDRKLSPATVRLDTAVLFLAFRDSATVEERRRLAREMHDGVAQEMASLGYFVDTLVDQEPEGSDRARQLTHAARAADDGRRRGTPLGPDAAHRASARTTPSAPRSARWPATSARAAAPRSTSPSTSRRRGCVPRSRASCCASPRRP